MEQKAKMKNGIRFALLLIFLFGVLFATNFVSDETKLMPHYRGTTKLIYTPAKYYYAPEFCAAGCRAFCAL